MALQHLSEEQVRTWNREQKDRWWFDNVYRGDTPQLTLRAALTGFLLGGILSATNLYVGAMTGPLISGLAAYMWIEDKPLPWLPMMAFNVVLSLLGVLVAPESVMAMFAGAAFFAPMDKLYRKRPGPTGFKLWIETHEPICAGLVAGAALVGIGDTLIRVFLLK